MSEPLLKIRNHHSLSCGDPPIIDDDSDQCYVGYFENIHGEQWIFTLDRRTGTSTVRGGDAGWNSVFNVIDGIAEGLVITEDEQLWLRACWSASRR